MKIKHNLSNIKLYRTWINMKSRCYTPSSTHFQYYGGKGIKVCDEWKHDFLAFYEWSMANGYKEGLTIDRINNNGNYEPSNCRWATYQEQNLNLPTVIKFNYKGKIITFIDICKMTGLTKKCVRTRYERGWSIDEIINTPKINKISRKENGQFAIKRISN